jgi:hypothetical protein
MNSENADTLAPIMGRVRALGFLRGEWLVLTGRIRYQAKSLEKTIPENRSGGRPWPSIREVWMIVLLHTIL